MFDIAHVRTRYYPVRFGGRVLQLEPLKLPGVDKHGFGSMSIEHMISAAFKPKT